MSDQTTRRDFLKLACAAGAAAVGAPFLTSSARAAINGKYNILMITSDQERRLMHFPSDLELPNHERLAARGTSFSQYHTACAPCTPARATLYTGQHAPSVRMPENINFGYVPDLSEEFPTIGTMMREAGYYTAYKGKWHLSEMPKIGTVDQLERYGFSEYNLLGDPQGGPRQGMVMDAGVADDAAQWLRNRAPEINQSQPFFLSVNLINPHDIMFYDTDGILGLTQQPKSTIPLLGTPLLPPYDQQWHQPLPSSFYTDDLNSKPAAHKEFDDIIRFVFGDIPNDREDLWSAYLDYYINCHVNLDTSIGTLLDALEAAGLAHNTIILYLADHGEMAGAHQMRQKGPFIYKENLNLPLVIAHPDIMGGSTSTALASSVDVAPTLLSLAGVSTSQRMSRYPGLVGVDLSDSLSSPSTAGAREGEGVLITYDAITTVDSAYAQAKVMSEKLNPFDPCANPVLLIPDLDKKGFMRGIYDGRYKFARYFSPVNYNRPGDMSALLENNELELYDTWSDPDEVVNLGQDLSRNSSLINTMSAKLEALIDLEIGEDVGYQMPDFQNCKPPSAARWRGTEQG